MKPSERLNHTYTLRQTTVQISLDNGLVRVPAIVTFDLSPRPKVLMECAFTRDDVPVRAANEIRERGEIEVILENGTIVDAVLGATSIGGGLRLTLVPKSGLVTVREENSSLTRCKFAVLNFPSIWGDLDFHRYPDPSDSSRSFIYQHFQVHADAWLVDVIAVDSVMAIHHHLLRRGGSALTHTGTIVRTDGQAFSLDELQDFLSILHLFLSLARGSYCGLTYLSAHDVDRNRVWEQWGTYKVEPWQRELPSWMDPLARHELSSVFEGFWSLFEDPARGEAIPKILQWYLRSNESSETGVGVVLAYAALERLSFLLKGARPRDGMTEGDWMAKALQDYGIDVSLPVECVELTILGKSQSWSHGPHALKDIRNDLVHPENRHGPFSEIALREAQSLGLFYIELLLLRLCGYTGQFVNRLKERDSIGSRIDQVPWAVDRGKKAP